MITFQVIRSSNRIPDIGTNIVYLRIDHWNDFSFVTMFDIVYYDESGNKHELGQIKIGFKGQDISVPTYKKLPDQFENLDKNFFSMGVSSEYYEKCRDFNKESKERFLKALNDVVADPDILESIMDEHVFNTSLLRDVNISLLDQYKRILAGGAVLTNFKFFFYREETDRFSELRLDFSVTASSSPSSNIHAIIGRNGIGKTTLLNSMINAICNIEEQSVGFYESPPLGDRMQFGNKIAQDYFTGLVSVSFSIFDSFAPPPDQDDSSKGICYHYVGLKRRGDGKNSLKSLSEIQEDCLSSLKKCFNQTFKTIRWQKAIEILCSDNNFAEMGLLSFVEKYNNLEKNKFDIQVKKIIERMSSGHSIVLLTITKLVELVEEKTLVLIDEPESHLHPPLLSAFIRALSELLHNRNGIAILATHSPVILQEIPKRCVWIINRVGRESTPFKPDIETFGENVGILTKEVFGLEVEKSGFHYLLNQSVENNSEYDAYASILYGVYDGQLGFEGKAILRSLLASKKNEKLV